MTPLTPQPPLDPAALRLWALRLIDGLPARAGPAANVAEFSLPSGVPLPSAVAGVSTPSVPLPMPATLAGSAPFASPVDTVLIRADALPLLTPATHPRQANAASMPHAMPESLDPAPLANHLKGLIELSLGQSSSMPAHSPETTAAAIGRELRAPEAPAGAMAPVVFSFVLHAPPGGQAAGRLEAEYEPPPRHHESPENAVPRGTGRVSWVISLDVQTPHVGLARVRLAWSAGRLEGTLIFPREHAAEARAGLAALESALCGTPGVAHAALSVRADDVEGVRP